MMLVSILCMYSCTAGSMSGNDEELFSENAIRDSLTCVIATPDSSRLLLGSRSAHFKIFDTRNGLITTYPLPDSTAGWLTYDILPLPRLSAQSFLVSKQNHGLMYISYNTDSSGNNVIAHIAQVVAPRDRMPHKSNKYSVYALIDVDTMIIAGTSNGLMYLNRDDKAHLPSESIVSARYAAPLSHLRHNRTQFAQEAVFLHGDSVLSVTESGIYRVALKDFSNTDARYSTLDDRIRCWRATIAGDSLAVLWSSDERQAGRLLTCFSLNGIARGATREVSPACTWIGTNNDSIRCFGREGDFQCFRVAAYVDGR